MFLHVRMHVCMGCYSVVVISYTHACITTHRRIGITSIGTIIMNIGTQVCSRMRTAEMIETGQVYRMPVK